MGAELNPPVVVGNRRYHRVEVTTYPYVTIHRAWYSNVGDTSRWPTRRLTHNYSGKAQFPERLLEAAIKACIAEAEAEVRGLTNHITTLRRALP